LTASATDSNAALTSAADARSDACASRPVSPPSPKRLAAEVTKKTPARKAVASRRAMDSFFCVPVLIAVGWWFLRGGAGPMARRANSCGCSTSPTGRAVPFVPGPLLKKHAGPHEEALHDPRPPARDFCLEIAPARTQAHHA